MVALFETVGRRGTFMGQSIFLWKQHERELLLGSYGQAVLALKYCEAGVCGAW